MSKFCTNCGKEIDDNAKACPSCGNLVNDTNSTQINVNNIQVNTTNGANVVIQKREIITCIILSLVTCGIYSLYWFVCLTNDSNKVSNDNSTNGGMALLFTLVTCGIYSLYWNYKLGKKLYEAGKIHNIDIDDNSILYLILSIFGLGIVSYCLAQNELNKFAK